MGMGKAMTGWMEGIFREGSETGDAGKDDLVSGQIIKTSADWKGLERLRDTLLDAADTEHDDIVQHWAWHHGLEALPGAQPSQSLPPISRSGSEGDVHVDAIPQAAQSSQTSVSAITIDTYTSSAKEQETAPKQADLARSTHISLPARAVASLQKPTSSSTSKPSIASSTHSRPTTMPSTGNVDRLGPARPAQLIAASSAATVPRQLLLRPGATSASLSTTPSRPSLSERLTAASRPRPVSSSDLPTRQLGSQSTVERLGPGVGDPLAGMGVGSSVPKSMRKSDATSTFDPLGAGGAVQVGKEGE